MRSLKRRIEATLKPIIGEPLSDMWRYVGWQAFEFGRQRPAVNRKGEAITTAPGVFSACCQWSISGPAGRIVSSDDFGPDGERHDEAGLPFYGLLDDSLLMVRAIEVGDAGQLRFLLSQGYVLDVVPESGDPDGDQWYFRGRDKRRKELFFRGGESVWPPRL